MELQKKYRMTIILVFLFLGFARAGEEELEDVMYDKTLFEGDIILTPQQQSELLSAKGRGSIIKSRLWPGGIIPYTIDNSLGERYRPLIEYSMQLWSNSTCIRFKKRTNETAFVNLRSGRGCSSAIGRIGQQQNVYLASRCRIPSTIAHELGHALGFYHEQSRPDRDDYVEILEHNVLKGMMFNFRKYETTIDSLGTPYDFSSVMHYSRRAFSKNGLSTIRAKDDPSRTLGNRVGPTVVDINQMNLLYKTECEKGGQEIGPVDSCFDTRTDCSKHVKLCKLPAYKFMRRECKRTCGLCD